MQVRFGGSILRLVALVAPLNDIKLWLVTKYLRDPPSCSGEPLFVARVSCTGKAILGWMKI